MWNENWDDREYLLDDLLIEADLMTELEETPFWEGYRDVQPDRELVFEDEFDWAA